MPGSKRRRGLLVVVSSPSGAGKTTLCRRLMAEFKDRLRFSVSTTTRLPRAGEVPGVDYEFVGAEEFQRRIDAGEFAEWAEVHGNRYGTSRRAVTEALEGGADMLFDIDFQGGRQLKAQFASDAVLIWVLPPSLEALEDRLRRRATDSPDVIEARLATARRELLEYAIYDYLVVNENLDSAYDHLRAVYIAAHLEIRRASTMAEELVRRVRDG